MQLDLLSEPLSYWWLSKHLPTCKGKSSGEGFQTDITNVKSSETKREMDSEGKRFVHRRGGGKTRWEGRAWQVQGCRVCPSLRPWCGRWGAPRIATEMRNHIRHLCLKYRDWTEGDMCFPTTQEFCLHIQKTPASTLRGHPGVVSEVPVHLGQSRDLLADLCALLPQQSPSLVKPGGAGHTLYRQ